MYVYQSGCHLLHHGKRHRSVVDESARLSAGKYLSAQYERRVVVKVVLGKELFHSEPLDVEAGLNNALLRVVIQSACVRPLAEHQSEGAEHDGFSSTRLAGYSREASAERNVRLADKRIVFNM